MTTELTLIEPIGNPLMPAGADKDQRYRLGAFLRWLDDTGPAWYSPDLGKYRDAMLARNLSPATVSAHLSTVRGRYKTLARDRDAFYSIAAQQTDDPLLRKAWVDETVERLKNATDPAAAPVKVTQVQDRLDAVHTRLTRAQASALIAAPGVDTQAGLRDTSVIALMLCTGAREAEVAALDVGDLRQRLEGELVLHIREGKGKKTRAVPYGENEWVLAILDKWLDKAGITEGAALWSFRKGGKLRGRLSTRAIQSILAKHQVMIGGELTAVRPHDLRGTYAKRCYDSGMDTIAIQQNLGHSDLKTTLGYIGELDVDRRKPPVMYDFDLASLNGG